MHEDLKLIGAEDEQPDNLLEQLASRRQIIADTKETFIPVPGYDRESPLLYIRYRLLDGPEIDKLVQGVRTEFRNRWERQINAAVDTFIAACTGVYVDKDGSGNIEPLTRNGVPITGFTRDLAEGLQFAETLADADSHRQVVFGLFGNNDVMISQHNYLLNRWFGDTSLNVSREMFEGNL